MVTAKDPIRAQCGRIGAYVTHGRYDSREITQPARDGFLRRFLEEADPDGRLSPAERHRRAESLLKGHMARLALRSAQARRGGRKRSRVSTKYEKNPATAESGKVNSGDGAGTRGDVSTGDTA